MVECRKLIDILELYEKASGQAINRQKTTLFFNPHKPIGEVGHQKQAGSTNHDQLGKVSRIANGEGQIQGEHF